MRDTERNSSPGDLSMVGGRPNLTAAAASELVRQQWGFRADVEPLESERDQNWFVKLDGAPRFVLKIANAGEDPGVLDLQQTLMNSLRKAGLPCPSVIPTFTGAVTTEYRGYKAWLISVVSGRKLADIPSPSDRLWHDLGAVLGRVAVTLADLDHPAAHRWLQWDVLNAEQVLSGYRNCVTDTQRGAILDKVLNDFNRLIQPALSDLPHSIVHNDANDHNLLVTGDAITGLIDFGDALHTVAINDLAIACAYAMLGREDLWAVTDSITAGYRKHRRLTILEEELLPVFIRTRLATSVSISAYQQTLEPDNPYLRISEKPIWDLLTNLMGAAHHDNR